jgi:hypothetical protein
MSAPTNIAMAAIAPATRAESALCAGVTSTNPSPTGIAAKSYGASFRMTGARQSR